MKAQTFRINSDSKHLLAAMWEELLKIGFTDNTSEFNPKNQWHELSYISINWCTIEGIDIDINKYKELFAGNNSIENHHDVLFNLPEDWDKVLVFAKEQLDDKYWVKEDPLITEAKRRYPSGTKFIPAHIPSSKGYCIVVEEEFFIEDDVVYCKNSEGYKRWVDTDITSKYGNTRFDRVVYDSGRWAEIHKEPIKKWDAGTYAVALKDEVNWSETQMGDIYLLHGTLADNITRNEKGLLFTNRNENSYKDSFKWFPTLSEAEEFSKELLKPKFEVGKWYSFNWDWHSKDNGKTIIKVKETTSDGVISNNRIYLYRKNDVTFTWEDKYNFSEISNVQLLTDLSEIQQYLPDGHPDKIVKKEFKEGEYIVLTESDFSMVGFTINRCYKIRESYIYFKAVLDDNNSKYNGYSACTFNNSGKIKWRYATPEEIKEYNRLGKPYDVTTLNKPFVLPKKWCIRGSERLAEWQRHDMKGKCNAFLNVQGYYYFPYDDSLTYWAFEDSKMSGYTEITFEQFMEYVVKPMSSKKTFTFGNLEFAIDKANEIISCKEGDILFDDVEYLYKYFNKSPERKILGYECKVDNININIKFGCCHGTFKELETIYKEITK